MRSWVLPTSLACVAMAWPTTMPMPRADAQVFTEPRTVFDASFLDRWWSWAHWWEFNRHRFVGPPAVVVDPEALPDDDLRARAVEALIQAAGHERDAVRAAAAVALGQSRDPAGVPTLEALRVDPAADVRRAAWIGLGLEGSPRAVAWFDDEAALAELDADAASGYLAGLAALDALPRSSLPILRRTLEETRNPALAQLAAYAIRRHRPRGTAAVMERLVLRSREPRVVGEALIGLGAVTGDEGFGLIGDVFLGQNRWNDTAVFRRFDTRGRRAWYVWRDLKAVQASAAIALAFASEEEEDRGDLDAARLALLAPFDREAVLIRDADGDRDGAIVAARPRIDDGVFVTPVPSRFTSNALDVWFGSFWPDGVAELRLGLVALGHVAFEDEAERLIDVTQGNDLWLLFNHDTRRPTPRGLEPRRGFALIGLGAYLRRVATLGPLPEFDFDDELERDDTWRRTVRRLRRVAADRDEPTKVRAAAVVGLGMSGDIEVADDLMELTPSVADDPVVAGHHLAALARVAGRRVDAGRVVVRRFPAVYAARSARSELDGLIAAREAVVAMGLLGRPEAVEPLRVALDDALREAPLLAPDVAWALRRAGGFAALPRLLEGLSSEDADEVMGAAVAVGWLLEPGAGRRLPGRLLDHPAFVFPLTDRLDAARTLEDPVHRVRAVAAPFLHDKLLPRRRVP